MAFYVSTVFEYGVIDKTCDWCDVELDPQEETLHMYIDMGGKDVSQWFCERFCHDEYLKDSRIQREWDKELSWPALAHF